MGLILPGQQPVFDKPNDAGAVATRPPLVMPGDRGFSEINNKLADKGLAAFDHDPHLAAGLNVRGGRIMHPAVAASLGFDRGPSTKGKVRLVAAE